MELADAARRINAISNRYADVYGFQRSADWLVMKLAEEVGELTQSHLAVTGRRRGVDAPADELRARFAHELADVIGIALALGEATGIDVERAIDEKWFVWDRRGPQRLDELADAELAAGERGARDAELAADERGARDAEH